MENLNIQPNTTYINALAVDPWAHRIQEVKFVIKCPFCGGTMLDDGMVYTSYPPQYKYICEQCGKAMWSSELFNNRL